MGSKPVSRLFQRFVPVVVCVGLLAVTVLAGLMSPQSVDADWYVNPGESIQAGIDAAYATGGGTVHVVAGAYHERINLKSGVVVQGAGASITTINGDASGTVVTASGVDPTAKLDGFTITNGTGTMASGDWGAIRLCGGGMASYAGAAPTVSNCIFSNNSADYGGGMANWAGAAPLITNCVFSYNVASNTFSTNAAGGMFNDSSSPAVTNCTFFNNSAPFGGGMSNGNFVSSTITGCTFSNNSASEEGGGMVNHYWGCPASVTVTNCTFSNNSAPNGGGMANNHGSSPITVTNCIFSNNSASGEGGGMWNSQSSSPTVTNCILWGDTSDEIFNDASSPTVNYCDVQGGYVGAGHNIDADPLFNNPVAKDFHLRPGSPCIDQGNNSAPSLPANDFEGDPRILDGDGDGIAIVDMGADEAPPLANTPVGSSVTVPLNGVTTTFNNVTVEGNTSVIWSAGNPVGPTPPNFYVAGRFTDIKTTATYSGSIIIGLSYSESDVRGNERDLRLYHWTGSIWDDVTTSVDTTNHIVYGRVNSLSWFFIGGKWVWVDDGAHHAPVFPSIYVGIGAALGAGIVAYAVRRRLASRRPE